MASAARLKLPLCAGVLTLLAALLASPAARAEASCEHAATPAYQVTSKQARQATLCLINKRRQARGLKRLVEHRAQRKAAKKHTREMLRKRCFDHRCPGEGDLVARVSATSYLPCGCRWSIAENIAYGHGSQSSPKRIVKAWMSSAPHRANILGRFEHIGIGVKPGSPTGGGRAATYTTTFGFRD